MSEDFVKGVQKIIAKYRFSSLLNSNAFFFFLRIPFNKTSTLPISSSITLHWQMLRLAGNTKTQDLPVVISDIRLRQFSHTVILLVEVSLVEDVVDFSSEEKVLKSEAGHLIDSITRSFYQEKNWVKHRSISFRNWRGQKLIFAWINFSKFKTMSKKEKECR